MRLLRLVPRPRSVPPLRGLTSSSSSSSSSWLAVSPDVEAAVVAGAPVVALETALLTHGLPAPHGLDTALASEAAVRAAGALPATVGVLGGRLRVGLSPDELASLADNPAPAKASLRDLPRLLASPEAPPGGATVAASLVGAHAAGIGVLATGGLGGAHRGAERSWDVSADLGALARTPVCVVCAGAKSVLDVGRTLELLEALGVPVLALGTDDFPAFLAPSSGIRAPARVDSPAEAAAMVAALRQARPFLTSGLVLAAPIPRAEVEAAGLGDAAELEAATAAAAREAEERGVAGHQVTPFLLGRVAELTRGASVRANVALIRHNARVGAQVAVALAEIERRSGRRRQNSNGEERRRAPDTNGDERSRAPDADGEERGRRATGLNGEERRRVPDPDGAERPLLFVGGSNLDLVLRATGAAGVDDLCPPASHPGLVVQAAGGVARNVAEAAARLGAPHQLLTALGDDWAGEALRRACSRLAFGSARVLPGRASAQYAAVLNTRGELMFGLGDFDAHAAIDADYVGAHADLFARARVVLVDANPPAEGLRAAARLARAAGAPLWLEPTDVLKAVAALDAVGDAWPPPFASPNVAEFDVLLRHLDLGQLHLERRLASEMGAEPWRRLLQDVRDACRAMAPRLGGLLVKLGPRGAFLWPGEGEDALWCAARPLPPDQVASVSGAGDCLVGALLAARWARGWDWERSLHAGLMAAHASLRCRAAVSPELTPDAFAAERVAEFARDLPSERV